MGTGSGPGPRRSLPGECSLTGKRFKAALEPSPEPTAIDSFSSFDSFFKESGAFCSGLFSLADLLATDFQVMRVLTQHLFWLPYRQEKLNFE